MLLFAGLECLYLFQHYLVKATAPGITFKFCNDTHRDKPLRLGYSQAEVAAAFEDAQKSIGDFDTEALQQFVDKYFAEPGR